MLFNTAFRYLKTRGRVRSRAMGIAAFSAQLGLPLFPDHKKLASFRNKHKGQRVFIIGNGPSLKLEDLDTLHSREESSMGSNRVFKAFSKTTWRPLYYLSVDKLLEEETFDIAKQYAIDVFSPTYFRRKKNLKVNYIRILDDQVAKPWPRFSGNAFFGFYQGYTVTYIAIQLAAFMGFEKIYLLGVDHNYSISAGNSPAGKASGLEFYQTKTEKNYFLPDYHLPGDKFFRHKPQENEMAYIAAQRHSEQYGFKVYNASRGGELKVFERVDFDSLFK